VDTLRDFGDSTLGKFLYARGQLNLLALRIYGFELMPFVATVNHFDARIPPTPDIEIYSSTMSGVSLAYGLPIGKMLSLGITLRPAYRVLFSGAVAFSDLMDFVDNDDMELQDIIAERQGMTLGADIGFIWRPGKAWRFGLLAENAGYAGGLSEDD